VHNPSEPGGDVGSKATLGDLSGLKTGFQSPISMIDNTAYDPDKAYKDSKLCNVITCLELSRKLSKERSKVTSNCFNPGLVPTTGLFRSLNPFFVAVFIFLTRYVFKVASDEDTAGAKLAYMMTSEELDTVSGKYFSGKPGSNALRVYSISEEANDQKKAVELWSLTEELVK
jgi:protochlorophyllide reductase